MVNNAPGVYKAPSVYKTAGGGGGGGDMPPYYPPVPDDINIFNSLFCTSDIGTYDDDKKIVLSSLSSIQNDNVLFCVDFETKEVVHGDWFQFFYNNGYIQFGWSYAYSDSTRILLTNGGSQYLFSVPTSYANSRRILSMINENLIENNTVLTSQPSIYSTSNIGPLSFPGNHTMLSNKMFYHGVKITKNGIVLCDLVPAKKNNIPGFYDKLSANFYNATNHSVWDCE